jgi:FKBP-type peptidyl-prolyl cis-trans isomerase
MKKTIIMIFAVALIVSACNTENKSTVTILENNVDSVSYAIGANLGSNILRQIESAGDTNLSYTSLVSGFTEAIDSEDLLVDEMTGTEIINAYMMAKDEERREAERAIFSENIEISNAFFAENAEKEGVFETESGLQFLVVTLGEGKMPMDGDKVSVNYEGSLIDGEVFDSSYEKGKPVEFDINRVIPGWTEGLKLMPVGSKYVFYIPSELAYGENPPPGTIIEPYSTLVFTVELLDIVN